jgi:hypothetical protein
MQLAIISARGEMRLKLNRAKLSMEKKLYLSLKRYKNMLLIEFYVQWV